MKAPAIIITLLLSTSAFAAQPAFDCRYAYQATEKLLCANEQMAALDQTNSTLFYEVKKRIPASRMHEFNEQQRAWIAERNQCGWSVQCVEQRYNEHRVQLCEWIHWEGGICEEGDGC